MIRDALYNAGGWEVARLSWEETYGALAFKLPVEGDDVAAEPALFADDCCDTCGRVFGAAELAAFRDEACDEDAMPGTCGECAEREAAHHAAVDAGLADADDRIARR